MHALSYSCVDSVAGEIGFYRPELLASARVVWDDEFAAFAALTSALRNNMGVAVAKLAELVARMQQQQQQQQSATT